MQSIGHVYDWHRRAVRDFLSEGKLLDAINFIESSFLTPSPINEITELSGSLLAKGQRNEAIIALNLAASLYGRYGEVSEHDIGILESLRNMLLHSEDPKI